MLDGEIIHDGASIKIFSASEPDKVIVRFTDDITAYYKIKKAVIKDKGIYCCGISSMLLKYLSDNGIPTHFERMTSEREQLCRRIGIIPLEMIVRNVIAGSLAQRLGLQEGTVPPEVIYDLCYKSAPLYNPLINDYHALALGLATREELSEIYSLTERINGLLVPLFDSVGITLVDYKIEFGKTASGHILLADDITPDTARMWDKATGERLDKDRFRRDGGNVGLAYKTVYDKLRKVCAL